MAEFTPDMDAVRAQTAHPDISSGAAYWRGRTRQAERKLDRVIERLEAWERDHTSTTSASDYLGAIRDLLSELGRS